MDVLGLLYYGIIGLNITEGTRLRVYGHTEIMGEHCMCKKKKKQSTELKQENMQGEGKIMMFTMNL
jgi:hypothetical protein